MARATICELRVELRIVLGLLLVAVETPAHIHYLGILINGQLADVPVAVFAVQSRGNVRAMHEVHKVRHLSHRHPVNGPVVLHVVCQLGKFRALDRNLLMTAPALGLSGDARRRTAQSARMTIKALNSETDV